METPPWHDEHEAKTQQYLDRLDAAFAQSDEKDTESAQAGFSALKIFVKHIRRAWAKMYSLPFDGLEQVQLAFPYNKHDSSIKCYKHKDNGEYYFVIGADVWTQLDPKATAALLGEENSVPTSNKDVREQNCANII